MIPAINHGGIIFFIEPQLFVFLKDHGDFEISIQTLFSLIKKSCLHWDSYPGPLDLQSDALPTELSTLLESSSFETLINETCLKSKDVIHVIRVIGTSPHSK